jgi:VanZ family protein
MNRHRTAFLAPVCILLILVVFAPLPGATIGIRTLHDFAHAPIFGCVALLLLYAMPSLPRLSGLPRGSQYLIALTGATALGMLTELAQIPVGRDASWLDVRSDLLGAAAFLALFTVVDARVRSRSIRIFATLVGTALLAFHSLPLASAAFAYERRAAAFPVLADYTKRMDLYFVSPQQATMRHLPMPAPWAAGPGEETMQVAFASGEWQGLDFREPAPDWRGYKTLALDITNPTDEPLVLGLRVHDIRHNNDFRDRFNRTLSVPPRTRTILRLPIAEIESAPRTRLLDLRHIAGVIVFRSGSSTAREMDVSKVWLE